MQFLELALALFFQKDQVVTNAPHAERFVMAGCDDRFACAGDGHGPDLSMVAGEALDLFELCRVTGL